MRCIKVYIVFGMSSCTQRATAALSALPVVPGNNPAPAARSPAFQTQAVRSQVPADHPAVYNACSPSADASAPPTHGGDSLEKVKEHENKDIVLPDSTNASRRDADNVRRRLSGQDVVEGFDKSGMSFELFDVCITNIFAHIS